MAFDDFTKGLHSIGKPRRMTMTIDVEDSLGYSSSKPVKIDEYTISKNFEKDGWDFKTFIPNEYLERKDVTNEAYINFNTTTSNVTYAPNQGDNMKTKVVEQAAGFVGTVLAVVDGRDVPVADTKPYKTREKAQKAVSALAVDVVKNGVSQ
jgi:hypothetical protein